jgi:hypothetical protein
MQKDLEDYEEDVKRGNFKPIREWLRLKIHQHGSVYAPKVLLNNSLNEGYNPDYFVTYLETKYLGSWTQALRLSERLSEICVNEQVLCLGCPIDG